MGAVSTPERLPGVGSPGNRTWQWIGWCLLAAFVLAGAAGAFGNGPLNRATLSDGDVRVDYDRVLRLRVPTEFHVAVARGVPPRVDVAIETKEPDDFAIEAIAPDPLATRANGRGRVYEMAARDGEIRFVLHGAARKIGRNETRLAIGGAEPITIRQWVVP
jgi:hypothetical protein